MWGWYSKFGFSQTRFDRFSQQMGICFSTKYRDSIPKHKHMLVGGLEHFLFFHIFHIFYILGIDFSQLMNSCFSEGLVETTNQIWDFNGFQNTQWFLRSTLWVSQNLRGRLFLGVGADGTPKQMAGYKT